MEELVRQISERAGISAPQARQAAEVVLEYAKAHLPGQAATQVAALLSSGSVVGNMSPLVHEHMEQLDGQFKERGQER